MIVDRDKNKLFFDDWVFITTIMKVGRVRKAMSDDEYAMIYMDNVILHVETTNLVKLPEAGPEQDQFVMLLKLEQPL